MLPPVDAGPALEPESAPPDELVAPVRAVTAEVKACVADNGAHLHGRVLVTVAFRPTRDGGFDGVTVETPFANPQLTACLEDVFDQLRFEPTGRETFAPARYTFMVEAP